MNVYLLQLLGKWLSLVMIAALSLFHNIGFQTHKVKIDNPTKNMNLNVENQVIAHETQTVYTKKLPNATKIRQQINTINQKEELIACLEEYFI